jgi:hypothetical protein
MNDSVNQRFNALLNEKAKSITEFSRLIGVGQTTLNGQLTGPRGISLDTVISTLTTFPEVSADWLLFGKGSMYVSDNASRITGNESDSELDLIAQNARLTSELEEAKRTILILEDRCQWLKDCYDEAIKTASSSDLKKHA